MGRLLSLESVVKTYKSKESANKALSPYSHWFPIKESERLSGIVADLIGDGHLQGEPKWRIDYTSKDCAELERFGNQIYYLFGVKGKPRSCTTNKFSKSFNYGINCKPLARVLFLCGVPSGNKVLREFRVPKWILKDKDNFREFARRLFTCEGSVWLGSSYGVKIEMWKHEEIFNNGIEFFNQIKHGLDIHFGIKTTKVFTIKDWNMRKDGKITKALRLYIKRKDSLYKFYRYIGFENKGKQNKLKELLNRWGDSNTAGALRRRKVTVSPSVQKGPHW
jgi:hypothetical protein